MLQTLSHLGLPPSFIQQVSILHQNTSTRILVNGRLSHSVPLTTGSGKAALAPLLFICAMKGVAHHIRYHYPTGPAIPTARRHVYFGYVDDTTVYIPGLLDIPNTLKCFASIALHSGFRIHPQKSSLIPLGPLAHEAHLPDHGISWVSKTESIRILGLQFSASISPHHS